LRVVVVGAGLAGLTAAGHLLAGDVDVVVLEATTRVGGRAFTRHDRFIDGQYAEAGAEWIDTVHARMHRLIDRFGLQTDPHATTWTAIRRWLYKDGELRGPDELHRVDPHLADDLARLERYIADVAAGIDEPAHPGRHAGAEQFDALSIAEVIDQLELRPLARLFATRNMQGEFAAEPHEVSVLFVAQQRALYAQAEAVSGPVSAQRVLGGVGAIGTGLAAGLPPGTVRLGAAVHAIQTNDDHVRVMTDTEVFEADHVVLACSLVPVRQIHFDPPLPAPLVDTIFGLGYGRVTKTALQYPSRPWPAGYATTLGRAQRVYEPTIGQRGDAGILIGYTGGDGGAQLAVLDESQRMAVIEASQREMYARLPASLGGFSQAWSTVEFVGGSYAVFRPGEVTRYWEVLRRAHGRVHLAGEHTATWTGYLEGAVESGETVAARLLATG
jgi:monoamine oxidase